jgi:hypothetical protein
MEHRRLEVVSYYRTYLQRDPSPGEVNAWVTALRLGMREEDVVTAFLTSPEYQAAHGTSASFVNGLYEGVLGRAADPAGQAQWEGALAAGTSRAALVRAFIESQEAQRRALDGFYAAYFHRASGQAEEAGWLGVLDRGTASLGAVAVAFLASGEYAADAQAGVA